MKASRSLLGCFLAIAAALGAAEKPSYLRPADVDALPSAPADARISYGPAPQQFGDLRLPAGRGPYPVVILLHGGCWITQYANLKNTAALADALRKEGVATFNVEYRCIGQPGGGWPGTFQDVAQAADLLRKVAKQYSLDLTRVVAAGHSAGGHLALWLAARHRLPAGSPLYSPDPLKLKGVLAYGAIGDLKQFQLVERDICGDSVVTQLMGGTPAQQAERYAQGSPRELLPLGVPLILVNAADDKVVPPAVAKQFVDAAVAAGDQAKLVVVPQAAHHEYNSPTAPTWPAMRDAVKALLQN